MDIRTEPVSRVNHYFHRERRWKEADGILCSLNHDSIFNRSAGIDVLVEEVHFFQTKEVAKTTFETADLLDSDRLITRSEHTQFIV